MTNPRLLIPMHLDAMVLNQMASIATPFLRFQMDYGHLQSFESPEPRPFEGGSTEQPNAGVYLHWTLPAALRHGTQKSDGSTELPLVPNRWLVVRMQHDVSADEAVKAWIVESDWYNPDPNAEPEDAGTSPFVDPTAADEQGTPQPVKIGRARRLDRVKQLAPAPGTPFLRAIAPGSVTFAAFAPGVQNVFAFFDDLTDGDDTPIDAGTFTYHVEGWYADDSMDPLPATSWSQDPTEPSRYVNDQMKWVLYAASAPTGARTMLHAMVSGLIWKRDDHNHDPQRFPSNIPQTVKVAVANTAADALAALMALESGDEQQGAMLSAFHYDLLDRLDDPASDEALDMEAREHWFGASRNGTLWTVAPPERNVGDDGLPAPEPPALTPLQQAALDACNAVQRERDRQWRIQQSMQTALYDLWWKSRWQMRNDPPISAPNFVQWLATQLPLQVGEGDEPSSDPRWLINRVRAQNAAVSTADAGVADAIKKLQALLDSSTQTLKAAELPQYRMPNDPVLLVTGLGRSTALDPVESLLCRTVAQAVNALTIGGNTYSIGAGGHDVSKLVPALSDPNTLLPPEVSAIHTESFFLSPSLAASAIGGLTADAVSTAIDALPAPAGAKRFAPWKGAMPAWEQPWVPLLLDWEVTVLKAPAYTATKGKPVCDFHPENWQFDGTDFHWNTPIVAKRGSFDEADSEQMKVHGRTFVTPQLSNTLAGQLGEWAQKHEARGPALRSQLGGIGDRVSALAAQDILSQRLSGLMSMLVQRDLRAMVPPSGPVLDAAGNGHHGYPLPFPDALVEYGPAAWAFAPMAGTFFVINRLTVIDSQGRSVNLMLANYSANPQTRQQDAASYFYPVAGRGLESPTLVAPHPGVRQSTDATQRMLQLGPRFVQDARLDFSLISNDGTNADVTLASAATPLCGWIVPNQIDRSLALYAADGTAWGSVYLAHAGETVTAEWYPDPTVPSAPQAVKDIPNAYVRDMLTTLMARADSGAGFMDFFRAIDESLWTIAPKSTQDSDLDVLVGRPLAIVRASLSLKLKGIAVRSQDWWNTFDVKMGDPPDAEEPAPFAAIDGGVRRFQWPVRLGSQALRQDGLIAYFVDDPKTPSNTWAHCQSLVMPNGATSDFLRQIGDDGNFVLLNPIDDTVTQPAPTELVRLTMLVDPAGSVHAFTGLLPVTNLPIPAQYTAPGLARIAYLFRAGPFLTTPDLVRVPRPAETNGTWEWYDRILNGTVPVGAADGQVRFAAVPPMVKEGWLKFTPRKE